jgi:hypothetical protein
MKRGLSLIFSVLFFFAIQLQTLVVYAHINCDHEHMHQSQSVEPSQHADHEHDSDSHSSASEKSNETCAHQHHCCHASNSMFQAPKLQTQFFNLDLISKRFPSSNELAVEAPVEGPFQPPRA